jgi:hypothetical protein
MRGLSRFKIETGKRFIVSPWTALFRDFNEDLSIELIGWERARNPRSVRIRVVRGRAELDRIPRVIPQGTGDGKGTSEPAILGEALEWVSSTPGKRSSLLYWDGSDFRVYPSVPEPPPFPGQFLAARWQPAFKEEAELYGQFEVRGEQDQIVECLRVVEPRLKRLTTIFLHDEPMLHADLGAGPLQPLAVVGDGLLRLARLILHLLRVPKGVLLVDEVENGLHHSVMPQVWLAIGKAAASVGAQVFATTHSRECIEAAHRALAAESDLRLVRLDRIDGEIRAVPYDRQTLGAAIESGFEVR